MKLTIDYETRSEADLKGQGIWMYAAHPSTEILCMAIKVDNRPTQLWLPQKFQWVLSKILPTEKVKLNLLLQDRLGDLFQQADTIEAHNVTFERAIYEKVGMGAGFLKIPKIKWRCSAAKASAMALPRSLDQAGKALNLTSVKDKTGYFTMLKMCKPRKPTLTNKTKWNEDPKDFLVLYKYCMQDVETEYTLSAAVRDLSPREQKIWMVDQTINERGLYVDVKAAEAAISIIKEHTTKLKVEFKRVTGGVESPTQVAKTLNWLSNRGFPLNNLMKETVTKLMAKTLPADVRRVLEIRQSLSKSSTAKFHRMVIGSGPDGRMRDTLMYCGAERTGRWAGKRVQVHNMPREMPEDCEGILNTVKIGDIDLFNMIYGDPMKVLSGAVRAFISATPGNELICADYSSIEGRILAWLAREMYVVRNYEKGLDPYIIFAAQISGEKYEDIKAGKEAGVKKFEDIRFKGKTGELACGYQGGEKAIYRFAPLVPRDERKSIVKLWRENRPETVKFWRVMEYHAKAAIYSGKVFTWHNNIKWGMHKGFLHCRLPSGRLLSYYQPELVKKKTPWGEERVIISFMGIDSNTKQWCRQDTYGGKLVENIVQATARDILAEALVRLEQRGYPVVLHVHDEAIAEVPAGKGGVEEFCNIMTQRPEWAEDCPIAAEGFRTKHYKKG